MTRNCAFLTIAILISAGLSPKFLEGRTGWPLWESYATNFLDKSGRIVDRGSDGRTTSEGQSYALFFALVANDRDRFQLILGWTEQNLAKGGLEHRLPAWLWNKNAEGIWSVSDENSASDADLWIAYTLKQAGKLWGDARLSDLSAAMSSRILEREVLILPGLGPMLMPGVNGFHPDRERYELNASYLPVQLLLGLSQDSPQDAWTRVAQRVPSVIFGSSPKGFPLDWVTYRTNSGFTSEPPFGSTPMAGYDAIRVYLWAGMLDPQTPSRKNILDSLYGMAALLRESGTPPAQVAVDGSVKDAKGGVGFAAAVVPYLLALNEKRLAAQQMKRVNAEKDPRSGLYGSNPRYYDQNLILFASGWIEKRFSFDSHGDLAVQWRRQ